MNSRLLFLVLFFLTTQLLIAEINSPKEENKFPPADIIDTGPDVEEQSITWQGEFKYFSEKDLDQSYQPLLDVLSNNFNQSTRRSEVSKLLSKLTFKTPGQTEFKKAIEASMKRFETLEPYFISRFDSKVIPPKKLNINEEDALQDSWRSSNAIFRYLAEKFDSRKMTSGKEVQASVTQLNAIHARMIQYNKAQLNETLLPEIRFYINLAKVIAKAETEGALVKTPELTKYLNEPVKKSEHSDDASIKERPRAEKTKEMTDFFTELEAKKNGDHGPFWKFADRFIHLPKFELFAPHEGKEISAKKYFTDVKGLTIHFACADKNNKTFSAVLQLYSTEEMKNTHGVKSPAASLTIKADPNSVQEIDHINSAMRILVEASKAPNKHSKKAQEEAKEVLTSINKTDRIAQLKSYPTENFTKPRQPGKEAEKHLYGEKPIILFPFETPLFQSEDRLLYASSKTTGDVGISHFEGSDWTAQVQIKTDRSMPFEYVFLAKITDPYTGTVYYCD